MRTRFAAVAVAVALVAVALPAHAGKTWFSIQPGIEVGHVDPDMDSDGVGMVGTITDTTGSGRAVIVVLGFVDEDESILDAVMAKVYLPAGGTVSFRTTKASKEKIVGFDHLMLIVGDSAYHQDEDAILRNAHDVQP